MTFQASPEGRIPPTAGENVSMLSKSPVEDNRGSELSDETMLWSESG